jgi:ATP-dependent Lon protease
MAPGTETIPLFPLPLVVFPGEKLPLHIFEQRYQEMLAWCREGDADGRARPFGIALFHDDKLSTVGCTVRLREVVESYADGRLDIVTYGERRFRIVDIDRERSYAHAEVVWIDDEPTAATPELLDRAASQHERLMRLVKGDHALPDLGGAGAPSFRLAAAAGLDAPARQSLLEMTSESARLEALLAHYRKAIPLLERAREIDRRIRGNGYFRRFPRIDF